tara:strand:- start:459 stop:899 length:441 start_codon:yes stop_codon:yes gene_type:complete
MKNKEFTYNTIIKRSIDVVFKFYSDPQNINELTPWFVSAQVSPNTKVSSGSNFQIKIKVFGITVSKWQILIQNYKNNNTFTDIQVEGPFEVWQHSHTFKESKNKTLMEDKIIYKSKISILNKLNILKYIFALVFYYRKRKILSIFR